MNGVVWLGLEVSERVSCGVNNVAHFLVCRVSQLQLHAVGTSAKFALQQLFHLHDGHGQVETNLGQAHLHVRMGRI